VKVEAEADESAGSVVDVAAREPTQASSDLEDEDQDREGMTDQFVMLDKPHATAKLHLPSKTPLEKNGIKIPVYVWCSKGLLLCEGWRGFGPSF